MENEPTRVLAAANRKSPTDLPTVIWEPLPELLQAAGRPTLPTIDPLRLAPDLERRTFDPSKRIVPGVLRRNESGAIETIHPPSRTTGDCATVVAPKPLRPGRPRQAPGDDATVAWQEGAGNLLGESPALVRRRLALRKQGPRRRNGLSKLTWAVAIATAVVVGYTALRPARSTGHPPGRVGSLPRSIPFEPQPTPDPRETQPEAIETTPHDHNSSQLAGLERLAVDALLDGQMGTARRLYQELLAHAPDNRAYALTLEILSQEHAR